MMILVNHLPHETTTRPPTAISAATLALLVAVVPAAYTIDPYLKGNRGWLTDAIATRTLLVLWAFAVWFIFWKLRKREIRLASMDSERLSSLTQSAQLLREMTIRNDFQSRLDLLKTLFALDGAIVTILTVENKELEFLYPLNLSKDKGASMTFKNCLESFDMSDLSIQEGSIGCPEKLALPFRKSKHWFALSVTNESHEAIAFVFFLCEEVDISSEDKKDWGIGLTDYCQETTPIIEDYQRNFKKLLEEEEKEIDLRSTNEKVDKYV